MYSKITSFLSAPNTKYWTKTLSKFLSAQLVIQALNLFTGVLIIWKLSKEEYAYYTIANTFQSTMSLLADVGISTSLAALGGKIWQDRYRFGQLINMAIALRYYLAGFSVVIIVPILSWMLISNGASIKYTIVIICLVLLGLNFQLVNGILIVIPRLHSQIKRIQNLDIIVSLLKLILISLAYVTILNTANIIAISSIVLGIQSLFLNKWATQTVDRKAPINIEDRRFTISNIKMSLPSAIFFCFQGQLNVFLISIFGNTTSIAEIGALGRISVIFLLINSVMTSIVLPAFSRCQSYRVLIKRYFQILFLFIILGIALVYSCYLMPEKILLILGNKYENLSNELLLMVVLTAANSLASIMSSLNLAKAWINYVWIEIPLRMVVQIALLLFLDISTISGVLMLNLISTISPILVNGFLTYRGLRRYKVYGGC